MTTTTMTMPRWATKSTIFGEGAKGDNDDDDDNDGDGTERCNNQMATIVIGVQQ